jgi:hypothetical protein
MVVSQQHRPLRHGARVPVALRQAPMDELGARSFGTLGSYAPSPSTTRAFTRPHNSRR